MSTNGHITLWVRDPGKMKVKVPNVPPVTHVKAPFLAVFWANSTTMIKRRGHRTRKRGVVRARSYDRRHDGKAIARINKKIKLVFKLKHYRAKWAFLVTWIVTYAGGWKKTPVS